MATQHFKRNLLLNFYREEKISLVCFLLSLKRDKNVWRLQPISSVWRPLAFLPVTLSEATLNIATREEPHHHTTTTKRSPPTTTREESANDS